MPNLSYTITELITIVYDQIEKLTGNKSDDHIRLQILEKAKKFIEDKYSREDNKKILKAINKALIE